VVITLNSLTASNLPLGNIYRWQENTT